MSDDKEMTERIWVEPMPIRSDGRCAGTGSYADERITSTGTEYIRSDIAEGAIELLRNEVVDGVANCNHNQRQGRCTAYLDRRMVCHDCPKRPDIQEFLAELEPTKDSGEGG